MKGGVAAPSRPPLRGTVRARMQGDDVEILIITKDGVRSDTLALKRD